MDAGAAHELGEEDGAEDCGAARGDHGLEAAPAAGSKACLGSLRLAKQYPAARIEPAAARALHFRTLNSGSLASMLKNNLDQLPLPGEEPQQALPLHENIRGRGYYH